MMQHLPEWAWTGLMVLAVGLAWIAGACFLGKTYEDMRGPRRRGGKDWPRFKKGAKL